VPTKHIETLFFGGGFRPEAYDNLSAEDPMGLITAIEPQKNRGNRRSVFVDGEFVAGVHEDIVMNLGLAVGQAVDTHRLGELLRAETVRKARERALGLISYRDRSKDEVRRRLVGSDFPEDVVLEVVEQLSNVELLDDDKFSRDWVKARTQSKPMGRARLSSELRSRGVDKETVENALSCLDETAEYRLAHELAVRRLDKMDRGDPSLRKKLASFLARRGFGWGIVGEVMESLRSEWEQ
jgi:regulatory protein